MSYKLVYDEKFVKKAAKLIKRDPSIKERIYKTLHILETDPHHPSLRLHKLKGNLSKFYSVSVTMKYRIIIDLVITDKEVYLIDIGSHEEVY
jgi:mRNA-degrading endonuclease YafQ of YafQ-DinJ toxin-antitoxin module